GQDLGTSQAPMYLLARVAGVPVLGLLIDIGALVSLFAGTLACITAAARVLLLMAHNGLAHNSLRTTHARNQTPSRAVVITGIAALLPVAVLAVWMCTAGSAPWRPMVLSSLMHWFALRCHATCATTAFSVPGPRSFPGWPALPCCSRWWGIYTLYPRGRMASCPTSISLI